MKPRLHNNAAMFERKGNPWHGEGRAVTRRPHEQLTEEQKFDALLQSAKDGGQKYAAEKRDSGRFAEDPNFDQFAKARKAEPRVGVPSPSRKPTEVTAARKLANALRNCHRVINEPEELLKKCAKTIERSETILSAHGARALEERRLQQAKKGKKGGSS